MPYANQTEYDFVRHLVETPGLIPDDVSIQVLTPCHKEAVQRTVESVRGAKNVILFTFLASSDNYRETILGMSEEDWIHRAREVTAFTRSITKDAQGTTATHWTFNFGFEDFANARLEPVVKCAEAVMQVWQPTTDDRMLFSIATSVEISTPNVFADQVERLCQTLSQSEKWRLSVHTHNDRGGAVASAELATLAGADRVEGCLFGNGERAGNMDLVTFGLNMLTQGLCTGIDFSYLDHVRREYEEVTRMTVHPRTPYSGDYSLKAFSGMHQSAISKGLKQRQALPQVAESSTTGDDFADCQVWKVPYLPLDPVDIGRTMDDVMAVSNQSGKAGVQWIMKHNLGIDLSDEQAAVLTKRMKEQPTQPDHGLSQSVALQKMCAELELSWD